MRDIDLPEPIRDLVLMKLEAATARAELMPHNFHGWRDGNTRPSR
jgi:hypothetical protein